MKKLIIFISISIFFTLINAQGYGNNSQSFIDNFSTCTSWVNNGETRVSVILGWSTRKCYYREFSHSENITCGFKFLELQDMANIMRRENFDYRKGITSLKGADKYLYSPDGICTVDRKDSNFYY